jgi:hypothetical protein
LIIISFVEGAAEQYFFPGRSFPPTALAGGLMWSISLFVWFWLDTNERGYARSLGLNVCVIFLPIVALLYYFFRSRGARRGVIATVLLLLAYIASFALTYAGKCSVYYGLQS